MTFGAISYRIFLSVAARFELLAQTRFLDCSNSSLFTPVFRVQCTRCARRSSARARTACKPRTAACPATNAVRCDRFEAISIALAPFCDAFDATSIDFEVPSLLECIPIRFPKLTKIRCLFDCAQATDCAVRIFGILAPLAASEISPRLFRSLRLPRVISAAALVAGTAEVRSLPPSEA